MDVRSQLRRAAHFHDDREAIVVGDRRLTFGEAWTRGLQTANLLLELGLRAGDRVGVLEDNSIEAVDLFLGAAAANVVRVPLYPRNSVEAHRHMLGHTQCRALIVSDRYAEEAKRAVDGVDGLDTLIVRDVAHEERLLVQSTTDPNPRIEPDDLFIIRHTGGTTGLPRAVAYSHWKWLASGRDWFYAWPPMRVGDTLLHVGPISHGSGYLFVPTWIDGGRNILLSEFEPEQVLDVLEQQDVRYSFMVSTMINSLVHHPTAAGRHFPRLKVLNIGAAPISDDTARRAQALFGPCLYQAYGQTEALPATMSPPEDWIVERDEGRSPIRSAGRPLAFAEVEVRDPDTGEILPYGSEGEIAVRTDAAMSGFWDDAEATEARMDDGWVLTGDIGVLDHDGFLYIMDRKDDVIISGGFNIWPAEIENVLLGHPDVLEAAVFAVPHERWGETPAALCVLRDGAGVTADELVASCIESLGSYKKPTSIRFTRDPLPKSPVGKVQRALLAAPFWGDADRRVSGA